VTLGTTAFDLERRQRVDSGYLTPWLVDEAKAGRVAIPIGELLGAVGPSDDAALGRLADHRVELEAPAELDPPTG